MNKCSILGVDVSVTNMKETVWTINNNLENERGNYICVSNVHTIVMAYENKKFRDIQNQSFMVLPDGGPLSVVSKFYGFKEAERVTGPDLMVEIFKISKEKGYKHFFYGSTERNLKIIKQKLEQDYKGIDIVGMYSPPFRNLTIEEDIDIINKINNSNPDFVWVGLGAPKQEIWMNNHRNKINALMIGVGAGFDYCADNIKRAPNIMQKFCLEWLYRLIQDPKRLIKRYMSTNFKFIYLILTKK